MPLLLLWGKSVSGMFVFNCFCILIFRLKVDSVVFEPLQSFHHIQRFMLFVKCVLNLICGVHNKELINLSTRTKSILAMVVVTPKDSGKSSNNLFLFL
jgi:hypothetical protein